MDVYNKHKGEKPICTEIVGLNWYRVLVNRSSRVLALKIHALCRDRRMRSVELSEDGYATVRAAPGIDT